jgi:hypothetical protein
VLLGRDAAQLGHLAEDGDGAPARLAGGDEGLQPGRHRGRVGVVGVVPDGGPVGPAGDLHPHGRQLRRGQPGRDVIGGQPERPSGRGGGQGVGDQVLTRGGERDVRPPVRGDQRERRPRVGAEGEAVGPDVSRGVDAVGDDPRPGALRHPGDQGVVGVQDRDPVGREGLGQLALGPGDGGLGAEHLVVGQPDVGDHADVGAGGAAQLGDVADPARAHLDHEDLGVRLQPGEGERQPDLVVERLRAGQRPPLRGEHGGEEVLGEGLARRAGDPDDLGRRAVADRPADGGERGQRVRDLDAREGGHP